MLTRKRRFLVGSLSSLVWPAVTLLIPMGITFAAARVYAEAAPAPESCEAGVVADCADAATGSLCHACASGKCACFDGTCTDGGTGSFSSVKVCRDVSSSSSSSSSSSGDNGGSTSGVYVPGPLTVPGSSSSSSSGSSDDSGCTTSSSTTSLPLFAAPLAIGLLFALRRKKKR